jgi:hypothetical protein
MQFSLADAQRKERMGDIRGAQAAMETARKAKADANRFNLNKAVALGTLDAKALQSLRPAGKGAGSGDASTKLPQVDRQTAAMQDQVIELRAKNPDDPQIKILEDKIQGRMKILATGKEGPTVAPRAAAALTAKQNAKVIDRLAVWEGGLEARKAKTAGNYAEVKAGVEADLRRQAMAGVFDDDNDGGSAPAAGTPGNPIKLK